MQARDRQRGLQRTVIARRVVPELVAAVEGAADADPASLWFALPGDELELDLELVRVRIAGVCGLEYGPGVAAPGHEQLGGVVDLGELHPLSASAARIRGELGERKDHTSPPMTARTPLGT